jgi:hypothetical protein
MACLAWRVNARVHARVDAGDDEGAQIGPMAACLRLLRLA